METWIEQYGNMDRKIEKRNGKMEREKKERVQRGENWIEIRERKKF